MAVNKRAVAVLCSVVFLVMTGITIISPVLPFYAQELGATTFMVGLLVGGLAAARVVLDLPAGVAGDRYGNWRMMQMGLAMIGVSSFVAVIAFNYWMLLVVRIVEGIGSAFYITSALAALARAIPMSQRGRYMSYYVLAILLGQILGPTIGGLVSTAWGLRAPFAAYGLAAFAGMGLIAVVKLPASGGNAQMRRINWSAVKSLFRNRSYMRVNIGTLSAFFVRAGILVTICPLFLRDKFGFDEATIGLFISIAAFSSGFTMLPSGILADRHGRKLPFVASLVLTAFIVPLLLLPDDYIGLVIVYVLYGLALGLHGPMAAWATDLVDEKVMGTAMGLYRTIGDLGFLLGPMILTAIVGLGSIGQPYDLAFFFVMVWMLVAAFIVSGAEDPAARNAKAKKLRQVGPID